jgi:hypothetical protein
MRTNTVFISAILAAVSFGSTLANGVIYTPTPLPQCGGLVTQNCIVSLTRNGSPEAISRVDPVPFHTFASKSTPGVHPVAHPSVDVMINATGGPVDLNPADTWRVVVNTGPMQPVQVFGRMQDMLVERGGSLDTGYTIAVTGRPVRMAYTDSGCGGTGVCPSVADTLNAGVFSFQVDDATVFSDLDDRAAVKGFNFAASTDWVSTPPQLDFMTNTIKIDVANSHFEPGGTTVFTGSAELTLPFAMLRRLYDVDAPATLVPTVFTVSSGAPGAATSLTVDSDSVHVTITGLTFSRRSLRVVGRPVPRRPRNISATRPGWDRGRIRFASALPRGSRVRGYVAVCRSTGVPKVVKRVAVTNTIIVSGLRAGRRYGCTVQATSRAGLGVATTVRIPAR